jgi:hypothetical protein
MNWWRPCESNTARQSCKDQLCSGTVPVPRRGFEPRSSRFRRDAFTRLAYEAKWFGLPSRSSRTHSPRSPFGLRRGSLHSLCERRLVRTGRLELPSPEWRSEAQPIYQARENCPMSEWEWPAEPKLADTPPSPYGLRRGSLHSLRERRLVGRGRIRTSEPRRDVIYSHAALAACIPARCFSEIGLASRSSQTHSPPSAFARQPSLAPRAKAGRGSRGRTALESAYETARITDRSTRTK